MTDEERAQLEIEVKLRGQGIAEIQNLLKIVKEAQKNAVIELGLKPGEVEKFNEAGKRANATLSGMKTNFTDIAKSLLGPVGVAAGLYEVSKQLTEFAAGKMEMQQFAANTRLSTAEVSNIMNAMRMLGSTAEEARSDIASLANVLNTNAAFKEGSPIAKQLRDMGAEGVKLAESMQKLSVEGKNKEALELYMELFNRQKQYGAEGVRTQIAMAQAIGLSLNFLEKGREAMDRAARSMTNWGEGNKEQIEKYHQQQIVFEHNMSQLWSSIKSHAISAITEITGAESEQAQLMETVAKHAKAQIDGIVLGIKSSIDEVKFIISTINALKDLMKEASQAYRPSGQDRYGGNSGITMEAMGKYMKEPAPPLTQEQIEELRKQRSMRRPLHPSSLSGDTEFSGSARRRVEVEEDSNKTLQEIRDSLIRMETGGAVGGGGVGSTGFSAGQARRGILEGRRAGGGGAGGAGSGGAGGGPRGGVTDVPSVEGMTDDERNKLGLILKYESAGRNVMNYMGRAQGIDPTQAKGYTAQGYYQMLNTNWRRLAPGVLGPDAPSNAMSANFQDQTKVALALMRERGAGVGHWANFNPALRSAIQRGEQSSTVDADAARQNIDKTQSSAPMNRGLINAIIDFRNMPNGVKQSTEVSGDVFGSTRVSVERAPQGAAAGGDTAPYSSRSVQ